MYERGFLGHGHSLDDAQTRVPLVVRGLAGEWPEPLALSDLRGLLREHLPRARRDSHPRFVPAPGRSLLQFVHELGRPRRIALRTLDSRAEYDLASARLELEGAAPPDLAAVVRAWEATRLSVAPR
jgi:hypothetical protein